MKKKNQKHAKRVRKLALLCTVCTILLAVSTYAWFVGMQTVNVSPFDVEIAAIDGLSLSLSGKPHHSIIIAKSDIHIRRIVNKFIIRVGSKGMQSAGVLSCLFHRLV